MTQAVSLRTVLRDVVALGKPSITLLSVIMGLLGVWLAHRSPEVLGDGLALRHLLGFVAGTAMVVASANALNMVLERDVDALMARTKDRPLPTGRLGLPVAVIFGVAMGLGGTIVLYLAANPLTAGLGYAALVSYVVLYTPAKRRTPQALLIGAVPGAMPPLMGWTAVTGSVDAPGLVLFLVLLLWQLPHFLAIAVYRQHDYARAGFKTVPVVRGVPAAQVQTIAYATGLVPLSVLLTPLGAAGWLYGVLACAVSVWFLVHTLHGVRTQAAPKWARRVFLASLAYLPALGVALFLDRVFGG